MIERDWYEIGEACPSGARYPGDVCHCFDGEEREGKKVPERDGA